MRHLTTLVLLTLALLSPAPADAQQGKSPDEMRAANRAAAVLLRERLKRDRPEDYGCLVRIKKSDLLVVRGAYDHVEWVLRDVGVPYADVAPEHFERASLRGVEAVLVNCPGRIGVRGVRRLTSRIAEPRLDDLEGVCGGAAQPFRTLGVGAQVGQHREGGAPPSVGEGGDEAQREVDGLV